MYQSLGIGIDLPQADPIGVDEETYFPFLLVMVFRQAELQSGKSVVG